MGKIQSIASQRQEVKQRPNVTQQDWFFLPLSQQRSKKGAANLLNQTLLSQSSITKNKDEKCLGFPILPNGHTPKIQINSSRLSPGSAFQQSNKLVSVSLQILKEELECVSRKHCILELWRQANKKCSDVTVRNGHIKPQGKYDSEKQLSDHPGDFIISGMTTCGPHKAEQAARRLFFFCDQRGSGEELKHLGAPASFYSIIFSMSTFKIKKNAFLCYIITTFALLSCKEWENDCFLTVPPAYVCNILIWKFWLELMIVHICTAAWSCAFNLQYAGIKAVRAADYPLCTKPVPPQLLRSH